MANSEILKEFWYDLTDEERDIILNNCFEEYDRFLQGKEFDVEVVKRCFKIDNQKFVKCAKEGNLELIKICIQLGVSIHTEDDCALRWAAGRGYLEVVKYLVEQGANIHADDEGALRWASENGHTRVVEYLKSLS